MKPYFYKKTRILAGLFLMAGLVAFGQNFEYNADASAQLFRSSQDNLPFWMVANTNGAVGSETNYLFTAGLEGQYMLENGMRISGRGSFFYRDEVQDDFQRDELYVQFDTKWVSIVAGARRNEERFGGLSTVQDNFLLAGNARAIPGLLLEAPKPQTIFKNFALDWGIGHYSLNDDRFVEDARLHFKRLAAVINLSPRTTLRAGIQHYAQWAGTSPERGEQPDGFSDFIDVFLARRASDSAEDTDQANALGNHLGIYELELSHRATYGTFFFYHHHPFEDGSGTRLKNLPDGLWGFHFSPNTDEYTSFFKGIVLEYFQTTDQSGSTGDAGRDNYFRSGVYRSGWTYDGNIIGFPLISMDATGLEIANNRVRGLHLGISAGRKQWQVMAKVTAWENFGSFRTPVEPKQQILYSYLAAQYDLKKYGIVLLNLGGDWGDGFRDTYGVSVGYRIKI